MLAESVDEDQIIAPVAAVDVGKAELVCCVRVPGTGGAKRRLQEVSTHSTMTRSLAELANHLVDLRIERVVMEATSDYWRPVFYLLEAHGLEPWLVNARDVKHLPRRPTTDVLDAVWLCKVAERQMLRASFVPPRPIRQLRDFTRYRIDLVGARGAEKTSTSQVIGMIPRSRAYSSHHWAMCCCQPEDATISAVGASKVSRLRSSAARYASTFQRMWTPLSSPACPSRNTPRRGQGRKLDLQRFNPFGNRSIKISDGGTHPGEPRGRPGTRRGAFQLVRLPLQRTEVWRAGVLHDSSSGSACLTATSMIRAGRRPTVLIHPRDGPRRPA